MYETELKNNIKLLEEYKKAVDAGAIVSKTDKKGKITYVNDQFCKISGYTKEELLGSNHNIVRHPDVPAEIYEDLWSTIKRKETWKGKVQNRAKDGSSYYVTVIVIPILDDNDDIVEYLALRQDVTELEELNNFLEKRVTEEVEKNREKDRQSIATLTAFLENSPNPIIVYVGSEVRFANLKFLQLTNKDKAEIIGSEFTLDSLFDNRAGCVNSLKEINSQSNTNKVSISIDARRNLFYVMVDEVPCFDDTPAKMYTFNNITLIEYQKLKISYYSEQLEEFIKKIRREKKSDEKIFDKLPKQETVNIKQDTTSESKRVLNHKEKNVLKKSRENVAVTSEDYSAEIDAYALEKNEELSEIEYEINEHIREFDEDNNFNSLNDISMKLLSYASNVASLIEFEDLSYAISSLGELLHTITIDDVDETKNKKIKLYLSNIMLDLTNWRRNVFVEQTTNDIHYLDSSLFSTILQFELIFNKADTIEDEDDFEMF